MGTSGGIPYASGYSCPTCGVWVPNGQLHTCWNVVPSNPVAQFGWPVVDLSGIVLELKAIRETLEKIETKIGGTNGRDRQDTQEGRQR